MAASFGISNACSAMFMFRQSAGRAVNRGRWSLHLENTPIVLIDWGPSAGVSDGSRWSLQRSLQRAPFESPTESPTGAVGICNGVSDRVSDGVSNGISNGT